MGMVHIAREDANPHQGVTVPVGVARGGGWAAERFASRRAMCQVTGVPCLLAEIRSRSRGASSWRRGRLPGRGARPRPPCHGVGVAAVTAGDLAGRGAGGDRLRRGPFRASAGRCRPCVPMSAPGPERGSSGRPAPALYSAENTPASGRLPAPYERRWLQMMAEVRRTRVVSPMARAASLFRRCGGVPVRGPARESAGGPPDGHRGGAAGHQGGAAGLPEGAPGNPAWDGRDPCGDPGPVRPGLSSPSARSGARSSRPSPR